MRKLLVVVLAVLFVSSCIIPAYALDKRQENNKKIAEFVLDTIKFPYVLLGSFVKQNHKEVKEELEYKDHKGLSEALRKSE